MIILLGGTGMMGRRIAHQLIQNKHDVWQPSRQWLLDFQNEDNTETLHQELQQKVSKDTILINTIGIAPGFGNQPHKTAYATQKAIIDYCLQQNINKVITLSALSHYPNPEDIPYLHYKYRLDNELLNSATTSYIVRPSLIYAKDGASTRFFKLLTKSPILAFPNQPTKLCSITH